MTEQQVRPPGIECRDFTLDPADPKGRRCRHYGTGGTCALEGRFVCEEWERAQARKKLTLVPNGPAPPPAPLPSTASQEAPGLADLVAKPWYPAPGAKTSQGASPSPGAPLALANPVPTPRKGKVQPGDTAGFGTKAAVLYLGATEVEASVPPEVEAAEASGVEVGLRLPASVTVHPDRPLVAVPARTGRTDRHEITYRALAQIRYAIDVFGPEVEVLSVAFPEPGEGAGR